MVYKELIMYPNQSMHIYRQTPQNVSHNGFYQLAWMAVFLIVSLAAIYVVYHIGLNLTNKNHADPLDLAKGELTKDQYTDIKKN